MGNISVYASTTARKNIHTRSGRTNLISAIHFYYNELWSVSFLPSSNDGLSEFFTIF
jgi:hypothetical protein